MQLEIKQKEVRGKISLIKKLDSCLKEAAQNVRPSQRMIRFYNIIGRFPCKTGSVVLALTSIDAIKVIWWAGLLRRTSAALDVIYDYKIRPWRGLWFFGDMLWQNSYNCRSVRSRARFVQRGIHFLLEELIQRKDSLNSLGEKLKVVSLGSGSAKQLLAGIADHRLEINTIQVVLIDRNLHALNEGYKNAQRLGLAEVVELRAVTIGHFLREAVSKSIDLFEMVGVADYFKEQQLSRYFHEIYRALKRGGFFIGSNISSEEEAYYAHGAACWPKLWYRSQTTLLKLLKKAGFEYIWIRKCGLYSIWVAQKLS